MIANSRIVHLLKAVSIPIQTEYEEDFFRKNEFNSCCTNINIEATFGIINVKIYK